MQGCPRILIVEDDVELRDSLVQRLSHGFDPVPAGNAQELFSILDERQSVDAILLDVLLPGVDGLSVCKQIRKNSESKISAIPIIMVSALCDPTDRVAGLHAGADDYISKPFYTAELIARIYAVLRRSSPQTQQDEASSKAERVCFGEWELNKKARQLINDQGLVVMLTQGDYKLLSCFINKPNTIFTREELLANVDSNSQDLNNINVKISRLREKLGESKDRSYIVNVRNEGYMWIMPVKMSARNA